MDLGLRGKVALVTGGAQGIGLAIAEALTAEGCRAIVADLNEAAAAKAVDRLGPTARWRGLDVTDAEACHATVEALVTEMGSLDILVNNAGICQTVGFEALTAADWDKVLRVNLTGAFNCCQAVYPHMRTRGWGRIINLSSLAGKSGGILVGVNYSSAKAGMLGLTKALAREAAPLGVTVNAVAPGTTDTDLIKSFPQERLAAVIKGIPVGRLGRPADVAAAVVFLASAQAGFITGEVLDVNGGQFID